MVTHSSIWSSDWVTQGKHDTEQYISRSFKTSHNFETRDPEKAEKGTCWLRYLLYKPNTPLFCQLNQLEPAEDDSKSSLYICTRHFNSCKVRICLFFTQEPKTSHFVDPEEKNRLCVIDCTTTESRETVSRLLIVA